VEVIGVVGTVEEELSSLEKVAAVEPYPEEGHSELASVRASVADGADGGKLAGTSEELACLPAGAPAQRRGEGAPGQRQQGVSSRGAEQGRGVERRWEQGDERGKINSMVLLL
jgi:hypothetical protein